MADDVEVNADEGGIDRAEGSEGSEETEETGEKTGFLKSKLFKIIAGVILLLLIGGASYFFLAPKEELEDPASEAVAEETVIDEDTTNSDDSESDESDTSTLDMDDARPETDPNPISEEATTSLQEENVRMQQQIDDLKAQISQKDMLIQDQFSNQNTAGIAPIRNSNSVDYQQDLFDDSSMREPNRTPPPKPSWGEFDRINKK